MQIIRCAQMKQVEQAAMAEGITSLRLMENAGSAAARVIRRAVDPGKLACTVLCGSGNNGGDGFVVARRLLEAGAEVAVILACGGPKTPEATEMCDRLSGLNIPQIDFARESARCLMRVDRSRIVVDAVFGTGFHGRVEGPLAALFERVNRCGAAVFALDMPSGANADTGEVEGACIRAAQTITFGACKTGQLESPAVDYCGRIAAVDIGIPAEAFTGGVGELLTEADIRDKLPLRRRSANKGSFGRVACVCGSRAMSGAAYMAAMGALRCGAGIVTLGVPRGIQPILAGKLTEAMVTPLAETPAGSLSMSAWAPLAELTGRATAVALGCGLTQTPETARLVRDLVGAARCPTVLDADGINAVAGHMNVLRETSAPLILTPHPGEMARLTGKSIPEIQRERIRTAADFAAEYGVVLVLKGAGTVIASPEGKICVNPTGNPGMARGGSGDILAGMIAGFAAQGIAPFDAACCGVYIHGAAGDRCAECLSEYGMLPTDMLLEIPQIFRGMSR